MRKRYLKMILNLQRSYFFKIVFDVRNLIQNASHTCMLKWKSKWKVGKVQLWNTVSGHVLRRHKIQYKGDVPATWFTTLGKNSKTAVECFRTGFTNVFKLFPPRGFKTLRENSKTEAVKLWCNCKTYFWTCIKTSQKMVQMFWNECTWWTDVSKCVWVTASG